MVMRNYIKALTNLGGTVLLSTSAQIHAWSLTDLNYAWSLSLIINQIMETWQCR
jgi:hypothetical protein